MNELSLGQIFDISPMVSARTAVYPGDTPFSAQFLLDMKKGDHLTLSQFTTSAHIGAHADSPSHYALKGAGIEARSLATYMGPAQVIEVTCKPDTRIQVEDLRGQTIQAPRVLFKTGSFPDPNHWNGDFMSLSAELVQYLADKGVRLVGIDTPSIDLADDKILESHQVVNKNNMAILEGLVLAHVPPGLYGLVALPLRLEGLDASPVRAILIKKD